MKDKAIIVVLLLVAGGGYLVAAGVNTDPLKGVESGVYADIVVHAGILDGGAGGAPAASVSAEYGSTSAKTASYMPAALGESFRPLYVQTEPTGGGRSGGACVPMTNTLTTKTLTVPRSSLTGVVYTGAGGQSANVQLWKSSGTGPQYSGAFTMSAPSGAYRFADVTTSYGMYVYTYATAWDRCTAQSNFAHAPATPQATCMGGMQWSSIYGACVCPAGTTWNGKACTQPPAAPSDGGATCQAIGCTSGGGPPVGTVPSGASQPTGTDCIGGWNDPAFVAWLRGQGYNPDCVPCPPCAGVLWGQWVQGAQTGTAGVQQGAASGSALITVSIEGDIVAKNLAQDIAIKAEATIKTAAGKTITRSLTPVSVAASGGTIRGLAGSWDIAKADIGTGRTTIDVKVVATSQDHMGAAKSATGIVQVDATTDYTGNIQMSVRAAPLSLVVGMPSGESRTKTVIMRPNAFAPGIASG